MGQAAEVEQCFQDIPSCDHVRAVARRQLRGSERFEESSLGANEQLRPRRCGAEADGNDAPICLNLVIGCTTAPLPEKAADERMSRLDVQK